MKIGKEKRSPSRKTVPLPCSPWRLIWLECPHQVRRKWGLPNDRGCLQFLTATFVPLTVKARSFLHVIKRGEYPSGIIICRKLVSCAVRRIVCSYDLGSFRDEFWEKRAVRAHVEFKWELAPNSVNLREFYDEEKERPLKISRDMTAYLRLPTELHSSAALRAVLPTEIKRNFH
jgi:hypothetical protein